MSVQALCALVSEQQSKRPPSSPASTQTRCQSYLQLERGHQDEEGRSVELLQTIGQRELDQRIGRERRLSDEELCDLKRDLQSVISKLDPIAQEIVRRQATQSITEISFEMGISRSTLRDWMLQIRKLFEEAGFERYLES